MNGLNSLLGEFPRLSRGNSHSEKSARLGDIPTMEITREYQLAVIEEGMERKDLSARALEKISGIAEGSIKELKRGKRAMSADKWQKISLMLCPEPRVPLVGEVGAGAEVFPIDDMPLIRTHGISECIKPEDPIETVPAPPGSDGRGLLAFRLKGDSWKPYHNAGSIGYYESRDRPADECIGEKVVVKIKDGPTLFKVLKRGSKYGHYNLLSPNAVEIEDVEFDWCAIVTDMSSKRRY